MMVQKLGLVGLLVSAVCAVKANEIGTLLYSGTERQTLTQSRLPQDSASAKETIQRFTGLVRRTNGKNTIWLNSEMQTEQNATSSKIQGNKIVLQGNSLKVGDALDTTSGIIKPIVPLDALKK